VLFSCHILASRFLSLVLPPLLPIAHPCFALVALVSYPCSWLSCAIPIRHSLLLSFVRQAWNMEDNTSRAKRCVQRPAEYGKHILLCKRLSTGKTLYCL
jgi:hypothetical protein